MQHLPICFLLLLLLVCTNSTVVNAQLNVDLVGQLNYTQNVNDVWGYVDAQNNEYVLLGTQTGVSIVSLIDPSNPNELHFIEGANNTWRDLKVWQQYAYVVNEAPNGGGLLIIDLSNLPTAIDTISTDLGIGYTDSHNIFVDEYGMAYLFGAKTDTLGNGTLMLDLASNPTNPVYMGIYTNNYVHDGFVRDNIMWTSEIYAGQLGVVDVSDKSAPTVLATHPSPKSFAHACWLSDDDQTVFLVDEEPGSWVTAYNVSDLNDIHEIDRWQSYPGQNVIPHNTFVSGNYVITSYYTSGVVILDASNPYNLVEVGNFDTSPLSGSGFGGCWGVYPYLPSGLLIASDRQEGLFVLNPTYVNAHYLEGMVSDSISGFSVPNAQVQIVNNEVSIGTTDFFGMYATGIAQTGDYMLEVTADQFYPTVVPITVYDSVSVTTTDISLVPACAMPPTGLMVTAITDTSVQVSWNEDIFAVNYTVNYQVLDSTTSQSIVQSINSATNSILISNLLPDTNYVMQIMTNCGYASSEFSEALTFTTYPTCAAPNEIIVANTTDTGADINWSADESDYYFVQYREMGADTWFSLTTSDTTYAFSGLNSCATYEVQIANHCGWTLSAYGNIHTFTTSETTDNLFTSTTIYECEGVFDLNTLLIGETGGMWNGGFYATPMGEFDATGLPSGDYTVTYTVDNGTCISTQTDFVSYTPCPPHLEVRLLLEGAYAGSGLMTSHLSSEMLLPHSQPFNAMPWNYEGTETVQNFPDALVDWVLVELRDANNLSTIVASQAALLTTSGNVVDVMGNTGLSFPTISNNTNCYVVVRHRNHLDVIGTSSVLMANNNSSSYDFTSAASQAEGTDQLVALSGGVYALRAGDFDANGALTVIDFNLYTTQIADLNIYETGDANLDGSVTVTDFNLYVTNSSLIGSALVRY